MVRTYRVDETTIVDLITINNDMVRRERERDRDTSYLHKSTAWNFDYDIAGARFFST